MHSDEAQGMSIAAFTWSVITFVLCLSGPGVLMAYAAATTLTTTTKGQVLTALAFGFLVLSLLPLTAGLMGSVGKARAIRNGTHGVGLGEAAIIMAFISFMMLSLGMAGALIIAAQNEHFV